MSFQKMNTSEVLTDIQPKIACFKHSRSLKDEGYPGPSTCVSIPEMVENIHDIVQG